MHHTDKNPLCACEESLEGHNVSTETSVEEENNHLVVRSNLKKVYHSPVLTVFKLLSEHNNPEAHSREI